MGQLDLFQDYRPTCRVMVFPPCKRRALVIATATALVARTNAAGARYWNRHVSALWSQLEAVGEQPEAIEQHMTEYAQAVSHEMMVLRYQQTG